MVQIRVERQGSQPLSLVLLSLGSGFSNPDRQPGVGLWFILLQLTFDLRHV